MLSLKEKTDVIDLSTKLTVNQYNVENPPQKERLNSKETLNSKKQNMY